MLNLLFIAFLLLCALYLLWHPRKEVAALIIAHAVLQYGMTLAFWIFHMNAQMSGLLLGFMAFSTLALIWARNIAYSRELKGIRIFFTVAQWIALLVVIQLSIWQSPYVYMVPSSAWHPYINPNSLTMHPTIKLIGNFLLFSTFLLLVTAWGRKWNWRQSFVELGPFLLYLMLAGFLRAFETGIEVNPHT